MPDVEAAWEALSRPQMPPEAPVDPDPAASTSGAQTEELSLPAWLTDPEGLTPVDLADWQRGAEALARMPARRQLELTAGIADLRSAALEQLARASGHVDRLRWDTEAMLESGIGQRLGVRTLAEMSMEPPPPMLFGRLDPLGHTVLFGTGGVGKGLLAAWWTLQLAKAGQRVLICDYENHPDEWARRVYAMGGSHLLGEVIHVAPLTAAWGGQRGAIWEQADDLLRLASDWDATFLVIDSIVPACSGTDPLKPEAVSQYAGALELIGRPALSLGHVTKSDDLRYPFGSVFWHNLSRVTWSAKKSGERILLTHRKHNNYERQPATLVEISWLDGLPVDVFEKPAGEDLARRIETVLRSGPLTVSKICDALDEDLDDEEAEPTKPNSVRTTLRRGQKDKPPRFVKIGSDQWGNG
ncbi:MAG: AAA family ATPase [Chloroflexi bacterium]|nr:AAA family ATPase [Chloroflexota bacterium]